MSESTERTERKPTSTMSFTDLRGKRQNRTINHVVDIRDFCETAAYPWLAIAANRDLSVGDIEMFLTLMAEDFPKVARSRSWIQRRRWTCQPPGTVNPTYRPNSDGQDGRALKIIAANPKLSLRRLVVLLGERGIDRKKDWVRRCRGVSVWSPPI